MNRAWRILAIGGAAVLALAGTAAATAKDGGRHRTIVPRAVIAAVHADVTAIDAKGQTHRFTWDRGKVTAKSDASITIERRDGQRVTLATDEETRVRAKNGGLNVGDAAVAFSREGKAYLVLAFQGRVGPPPARLSVGPPKGSRWSEWRDPPIPHKLFNFPRAAVHVDWALIMADGKSLALAFDRGEVANKTGTSITLKRADGKSVTLAIDEKTKIRKDGVRVGDRAAAFSRNGTALIVLSRERTSK
jgi:hypothetical protein